MSVLLFPPADLDPAVPGSAFGCAWLTALAAVATAEVVSAWTGATASDQVAQRRPRQRPEDRRNPGRTPSPPDITPGTEMPRGPACGVVIGIGLNVNVDRDGLPADLRSRGDIVPDRTRRPVVDRSEVARDLIRRLDHWYEASLASGCEMLNALMAYRSEHLGRSVRVATPAGTRSGRLVDLDVRHGLTLAVEEAEDQADQGDAVRLASLSLAPRSSRSRRPGVRVSSSDHEWSWKQCCRPDRLMGIARPCADGARQPAGTLAWQDAHPPGGSSRRRRHGTAGSDDPIPA